MNKENCVIRVEQPQDYREVENLTREAFWNVYQPGCLEHYVLHCYREQEGFIPQLSLILELDGKMIGHVMYAHSHIDLEDGSELPIMTFGPISIAPPFKRQGYGKYLLDYSLAKAAQMGAGAIAMCGNIDFYGKCGFGLASEKGVRYEDADPSDPIVPYFLIRELKKGFLDGIKGTYKDPKPYFIGWEDPEGFAAYDSTFPYKEKLVTKDQLRTQ